MKTISPAAVPLCDGGRPVETILCPISLHRVSSRRGKMGRGKIEVKWRTYTETVKENLPTETVSFFFLIGSKILVNVCGGEAKNIKYFIWVIFRLFFKNK